jgi:hypothetical protein
MRSKQHPTGQEERIVFGSRRMIGRKIQGREIVKIVLYLRTGANAESRASKYLFDSRHRSRHWMPTTNGETAPGQRDIHCFTNQRRFEYRRLERFATPIEAALQVLLGEIDFLTGGRTFGNRQLAHRLGTHSECAFLAEVCDPDCIHLSQIGSGIDFRRRRAH